MFYAKYILWKYAEKVYKHKIMQNIYNNVFKQFFQTLFHGLFLHSLLEEFIKHYQFYATLCILLVLFTSFYPHGFLSL